MKLEPGIKYKLADDFINGPFFFNVGFGFRTPISNRFTQTEDIKSPQNAYFINPTGLNPRAVNCWWWISDMTGVLISLKGGRESIENGW